jgi:hypothetical protein
MHHASGAAGSGKEIATDQPMPSYWEADVPPDWSIELKSGDDERLEASYANRRGFGDIRFDPLVGTPTQCRVGDPQLKADPPAAPFGGRSLSLKSAAQSLTPSNEEPLGELGAFPRIEGDLVAGNGRFVGNFRFGDEAYSWVLRSPYPHARIRRVDTTRAAPYRVLAVLTGADLAAAVTPLPCAIPASWYGGKPEREPTV